MDDDIERRVYQPELERLTGLGPVWIRELEKRGRIPPARTDPGGKRKFWLASEARAIVAGQATADSVTAIIPLGFKADQKATRSATGRKARSRKSARQQARADETETAV